MTYILYNYNSDIISRINNINKPVIKLLKVREGTNSIYTNAASAYSTSAVVQGGKKRDAVASTSKFTSTSGKGISDKGSSTTSILLMLLLQVPVVRRVMQLHLQVILWLLMVKVELIKAVVTFPTFLLMLPNALRNYL